MVFSPSARLTEITRAVRPAVVLPLLFALGLFVLKQPATAGLSVFSTFAHLVMVRYDPVGRARFLQCATLTMSGVILIAVGVLSSRSVGSAVSTTVAVAILSELPVIKHSRIAAIAPALLLAYMLAVVAPIPVTAIVPQITGWVLGGVCALVVIRFLWITSPTAVLHPTPGSSTAAARAAWFGEALGAAVALGLAVLLARTLPLQHAFWVVLGILPVLTAPGYSAARTFWVQQTGTLAGFAAGTIIVALVGTHEIGYWIALPLVVFAATYLASRGLLAGQVGFTIFVVVLFCILAPQQTKVGVIRLEDIALGGLVSLTIAGVRRIGSRLFG